jgi:hypothetical protein
VLPISPVLVTTKFNHLGHSSKQLNTTIVNVYSSNFDECKTTTLQPNEINKPDCRPANKISGKYGDGGPYKYLSSLQVEAGGLLMQATQVFLCKLTLQSSYASDYCLGHMVSVELQPSPYTGY